MKKLLAVFMTVFMLCGQAQAMTSLIFGAHQSSPRIDGTGSFGEEGAVGFQLGVRADLMYFGAGSLQSGLEIVQRNFDLSNGQLELSFINLDIPIFFNFIITDGVGFYFGPKISLNLSDSCDVSNGSCTLNDDAIESLVFPLNIGFEFDLGPSWGLSLFYEYALTPQVSTDNPEVDYFVDNYGINLHYRF